MAKKEKIALILGYIALLILIINIASATNINAGENTTIFLDFEIVNCSVINSTYNLEGLNLSWYEKSIVISTVQNYRPDNLTINCWVIKYKEIVEEHVDGSKGRKGCLTTYKCSEWGGCINGTQTRDCQKENNYCYATKVNIIQNCTVNEPIENKTIDIKINEKPKDNTFLYILLSVFILFVMVFIILLIRYYYIKKEIMKKVIE